MKIISISGLDGSGKSTQIKSLKTYLESQGKKVFYFHAIQFSFAKKLQEFKKKYCLICKLTGKCQTANPTEKSVMKANYLQIQLRKIFLRIDIWRFGKLVKELEKEKYDYLLSDRFFQDAIINIQYLANQNSKIQSANWRTKFNPQTGGQNSISFYLQTEPYLIMQRDRKPDQGLEYLKDKKMIYDEFAEKLGLKIIDGNRTPEEIFADIKNSL